MRKSATLFIVIFISLAAVTVFLIDPTSLPLKYQEYYYSYSGEPAYRALPESRQIIPDRAEPFCSAKIDGSWRDAQTIESVEIEASPVCDPDNPYSVTAFVNGTNNIGMGTLMRTRLAPDTVVKENDLDGDGDPDEIHIRLEVIELNGHSPDSKDLIATFDIAPGIQPGFWVFAPKTRGMTTENFESLQANRMMRMPSPTIRVEQGDRIKLTLENTHYMPHTIHLHGVDHPFVKSDGEGNDGVPQTSGQMVMPGESRTYEMAPRQSGTMAYHCHVQTGKHILMGLIGMFIVEENRPDNWVQTFNVGAGHVRSPAVAIKETYDREYDLHYLDIDRELHEIIQRSNDPRLVAKAMNRQYNLAESVADYFLLNGRSFPYTLRESLVVIAPNENIKLRMFNAGQGVLAIHTHGHKPTSTHYDGVELSPETQITRDVFLIGSAQRVDLDLNTTNDGLHSYGEGIWLIHDHNEIGITTNGMMPGGNISAIVYESYLGENGMPEGQGVSLMPYFTKEYYQGELPVWIMSDNEGVFGEVMR